MNALGALEKAYEGGRERLLVLAGAIVGERATAEDVVHDVFAKLAGEPERVSGIDNLTGFLVVSVRNRAISLVRKGRRRAAINARRAGEGARRKVEDPGEKAANAESNGVLLRLVGELPEELREVLALRVWGELSFERIGEIQGVNKSTVFYRYRQALERLSACLRRGSGDE